MENFTPMLSPLALRALKPKDKRYEVTDKNGLVIRISPNGRMTWRINKSVNGKRITRQLGDYPAMSLADARDALAQLTNISKTTIDDTFEGIYADWLDLKRQSIKNWQDIDERMQKYILPKVGKLPFSVITPPQIIKILKEELESRGKLETIKRICGYIKEVEMFAINSGRIEAMRFQGIHKVFARPSTKLNNRPSVHPSHLSEILPKLRLEAVKAPTTWDAIMIGFYTLLRPGEYCALEWQWIDMKNQCISIPADVMKMKRMHVVPISTQLQKILENRPRFGEYVLTSPDRPGSHIGTAAQENFFRRHGMKGVLVPHGIRSIGRTWMAEERIDHDIAEMCLAHRVGTSVELAYNRTDFLELRRDAMQRWCDYVELCLKGGTDLLL